MVVVGGGWRGKGGGRNDIGLQSSSSERHVLSSGAIASAPVGLTALSLEVEASWVGGGYGDMTRGQSLGNKNRK